MDRISKHLLLGPKVSVNLIYLEPTVITDFQAPDMSDVPTPANTRHGSNGYKLRSAILSKLRVLYGVVDPYKLPAK